MSRIILTEDTALIESSVIEKEIALDTFLKGIAKQIPVSIPILPDKTKGIVISKEKTTFIVEQSPFLTSLNYSIGDNDSVEDDAIETYKVIFPWTYFAITLRTNPLMFENNLAETLMFFSKQPITSLDSKIGIFPIPNVEMRTGHGSICLGEITLKNNLTLPTFINDLISKINGSTYNIDLFKYNDNTNISDLAYELGDDTRGDLAYLKAWEKLSEKGCDYFIKKLRFTTNSTYKTFINQLIQGI